MKNFLFGSTFLRLIFISILGGFFLAGFENLFFLSQFFALAVIISFFLSFYFQKIRGFFCLFGIFCGAVFYGQVYQYFSFSEHVLPSLVGEEVMLHGFVDGFPDMRTNDQRVYVQIGAVSDTKIREKILLVVPRSVDLDYGDVIDFEGKILWPSNFGDFDYRRYLRRYEVEVFVKNPRIFYKKSGGGVWLIRTAKSVRNWFEKNLAQSLPAVHADIAMGVLIGVKKELPDQVKSWFSRSGLQHLLVVSGSNVTLVFFVVFLLCKRMGRMVTFFGGFFALLFFVLMTGGDPPVVRAAIMGSLFLIASTIGRMPDGRNFVLLAAVVMGISNPQIIQMDVSFWLSFTAMLGIVLLTPVFWHFLKKICGFFGNEITLLLAVALAAQTGVFAVLVGSFGDFPVGGLLANLVVEPIMPILMAATVFSAFLGWLPVPLAGILGVPAYILIEVLLKIAAFFSQFFVWEVPSWFGVLWGVLFGTFCLWALFSKKYAKKYLAPFEARF